LTFTTADQALARRLYLAFDDALMEPQRYTDMSV
jgi:hypothetical protein